MLVSSITIVLPDFQATQQLGETLGKTLPAGLTILLEGDLGAGKTTLVQGIAKGLGIEEQIVSPTFTLINEYDRGRLPLYHLDLYRLQASEVAAIYPEMYWEGIEVPLGITAIEWAQKLSIRPSNYINIQLDRDLESGRKAHLQSVGHLDFDLSLLIKS